MNYDYDYEPDYELKRHKTSDTVKWILTLLAFILVGVMLAGIICGWFNKEPEETPVEKDSEQVAVIDGDGNVMTSGNVYAMPSNMVFAATAAEISNANEGITLTATVLPESAGNKAIDWSASFVNPSSSWASGKIATDYVTVVPTSDGALTANVNCLKAFGEQIKITAASRSNPEAKADCILDFARRIVDTALYHEELNTNILNFGSDEVVVDMVVPSYEDFMESGSLWAGGYYTTFINRDIQLTPDDEKDPLAEWADESVDRTYKFSDYTIKDCMPVVPADGSEYEVDIDIQAKVPSDIISLFCNFAMAVNRSGGSPIISFADMTKNGVLMGNNPIWMALEMMSQSGIRMTNFDSSIYEEYMEDFIDWIQDNPDTPFVDYTITYTGKYSTFTRHFAFRFNPETAVMPVFSLSLDKTEEVI